MRALQVWRLKKAYSDSTLAPLIQIVKIDGKLVIYNGFDKDGKKFGAKHPNIIAAQPEYFESMCSKPLITINYELVR